MSRYVDITTINPKVYESSEVELGVLAYDYDEICSMPFLDIVQCGECRYWNSETKGCNRNPSVEAWQADDFCSYGERKESE